VAFLAVEVAAFGLYLGSSFAPNHIGMPLVSPKLKLDFLRRQVLMSRNISGGRFMSILMGGLNDQIEHHLFPSMGPPLPPQGATPGRRLLRGRRRAIYPDDAVAVLPCHHRIPQQRRTARQGPVPLPARGAAPRVGGVAAPSRVVRAVLTEATARVVLILLNQQPDWDISAAIRRAEMSGSRGQASRRHLLPRCSYDVRALLGFRLGFATGDDPHCSGRGDRAHPIF
jgi:hypothetical protein